MTPRRILLLCAVGIVAAGCMVGPDYKRPELSVPPVYRGADAGPPAAGARDVRRSRLVERLSGSGPPGADPHGAGAELRSAHRRGAHSAGAEPGHDRPVAGIPDGGRQRQRPLRRVHGLRPPGHASRQQLPAAGRIRRRVGTGLLGQVPPEHRGRAGRTARHRGRPLRGHGDAGHPGRPGLSDPPGPGPHAGNLPAHRDLADRSRSTSCKPGWTAAWPGCSICGRPRRCSTARRRRSPRSSARSSRPENFINILLGQNPGPIKRGRPLEQQIAAPALPPGLPSDLLTRRPDIRQAEQQLVAANAQIGVAKALLYPQVTISGFAGVGRRDDQRLELRAVRDIQRPAGRSPCPSSTWAACRPTSTTTRPCAQEAGLRYQQTLQQALREVSDALVDIRKRQEFRQQQELLVKALADASQVANLRYEGGVSSYLEVLDTERQLFDAELELVQAKRDESVERDPALQGARRRMAGRIREDGGDRERAQPVEVKVAPTKPRARSRTRRACWWRAIRTTGSCSPLETRHACGIAPPPMV